MSDSTKKQCRDFLFEHPNTQKTHREVEIAHGDDTQRFLLKELDQTEAQKRDDYAQNNDVPNAVAWVIFCTYTPDGSERVFEFNPDCDASKENVRVSSDVRQICEWGIDSFLQELYRQVLEVNGLIIDMPEEGENGDKKKGNPKLKQENVASVSEISTYLS